MIEGTIENDKNDGCFCSLEFLTLQDTHIIHIMSEYIKLICTAAEEARKAHQMLSFVHGSNTRKNKFHIFLLCTNIV